MTDKLLEQAVDYIDSVPDDRDSVGHIDRYALVTALKERLADPMREVQRLGQEIEQEPVALPCCGYTDASAVKWNPFNRVVQCHNCGQTYTQPQRTWVGLTDEEVENYWDWEDFQCGCGRGTLLDMVRDIESKLKELNT